MNLVKFPIELLMQFTTELGMQFYFLCGGLVQYTYNLDPIDGYNGITVIKTPEI